jgi:hypothetical protein
LDMRRAQKFECSKSERRNKMNILKS